MSDGSIVQCSGPPSCKHCAAEVMRPVDIADKIDELVNWQLASGNGW